MHAMQVYLLCIHSIGVVSVETKQDVQRKFLKAEEVADDLVLALSTVYKLCREGEIPCVYIGGSLRIPTAIYREWLQTRTKIPGKAS